MGCKSVVENGSITFICLMVCGVWILQKYVCTRNICGGKSIFILLSFDSSIYVFIQNILIICYMFYVNCINLPIIYFRVGKTTSVSIRTPIFCWSVHTHTAVLPKPPLAHQCLILSNVSLIEKICCWVPQAIILYLKAT